MISNFKLIYKSFFYYLRINITVIIGTAITSGVLTGALLIGDSLKKSLLSLVDYRLGKTDEVLLSSRFFFNSTIADSLQRILNTPTAPIIIRSGTVSAHNGEFRKNKITILGVDNRFWSMSSDPSESKVYTENEVMVNNTLAEKLALKPGQEIVLRFKRGDILPMEAPFSKNFESQTSLRLRVDRIINRDNFGEFSLKSQHFPVLNVFVPLALLSKALGHPDRATAVLIQLSHEISDSLLNNALQQGWSLDDAGLHLRYLLNYRGIELVYNNIFIPDSISSSVTQIFPSAQPIYTYFVNTLQYKNSFTPYSFVSTIPSHLDLADNSILLNDWTAQDIGVKIGDTINLTYYIPVEYEKLKEDTAEFVVGGIVPQKDYWADSSLMPPYPGLSDAGSCSEWDPQIPIDLKKIRPKDEDYWDKWSGTPKAFINLKMARKLWANRYGTCTAIRFPFNDSVSLSHIKSRLLESLTPNGMGFSFYSVKRNMKKSVIEGISFTPLFSGMSFFIIASALILTTLLFGFSIQSRLDKYSYLIAAGFTRMYIMNIFWGESLITALCGALAGTAISPLYTSVILRLLRTFWYSAANTPLLQLHVGIVPCILGAVIILCIMAITQWFSVRFFSHRFFLKKSSGNLFTDISKKGLVVQLAFIFVCIAGSVVFFVLGVNARGQEAAGYFFGTGTFVLTGILLLSNLILRIFQDHTAIRSFTLLNLAILNLVRSRSKSIGTASIFACSIFILGAVLGFRHGKIKNEQDRSSGTGGFTWYCESTTPIPLSHLKRSFLIKRGLPSDDSDFFVVPLRLREGNDASCLNLNRVQSPPLIGVNQTILDSLRSFSFTRLINLYDGYHPWKAFDRAFDDGTIPGFADQNVMDWGLGKSLGDTLFYVNDRGQTLKIVLVGCLKNSIFQGRVLISDRDFLSHFPSKDGYSIFLVNSSRENAIKTGTLLKNTFMDYGIEIERTSTRLALFNEVENTYISIFSFLGFLGLLLGSAGLGIVVLRNVLERRHELAVLRAQGFMQTTIRKLLFTEHFIIFTIGILSGTLAAAVATLPTLLANSYTYLFGGLFFSLCIIVVFGFLSIWISTGYILREDTLSVLREE